MHGCVFDYVLLCVCRFTRGYKSWITHRALICSKPVSSVQREEFFLALPLSLPFCLFVSRSVFLSAVTLSLPPATVDITHSHQSLSISPASPLPPATPPLTPLLIYSPLFRLPSLFLTCSFVGNLQSVTGHCPASAFAKELARKVRGSIHCRLFASNCFQHVARELAIASSDFPTSGKG